MNRIMYWIKTKLKLKITLAIVILTVVGGYNAHAQQTIKHTKSSNIPYLEHLPADYKTSNKNYPLLIFLHGNGEKGDGSDAMVWDVAKNGPPKLIKNGHNMSFNVNGKNYSFIVISPQLLYGTSNWPTNYIDEIVKYALANYRVDLSRIYLTGLSLGGGGVWRYSGINPDLFAAIAPIAGAQSLVNSYAKAMANENLPVWAFHGDADNVIDLSASTGWVDKINYFQPNPAARLTIYKGVGHNSWDRAYDTEHTYHSTNLYEWMLSHTKGNVAQPALPAPVNLPPTVDAGQDQTVTLPITDVALQGSASDKDGSIAKYQWEEVSGPTQASLSGSTSATAKVNNLAAGEYQFKLTATDDKGASASDVVVITVTQPVVAAPAPPDGDCGCDYTIPEGQHITDGKALGIKPGDVICLQAGLNYNALKLINIVGSADKPVIIKNCGGKVSINVSSTFAIKTNYCQYFRITGSGDAKHKYGIELAGANSLGLSLDMLSSNFEVDHVEIHHVGFAGIMAKTDPSCEVPSGRDKFTMREVKIHNNYIHDTNGEGMYIGNSFYAKGVDLSCGTVLPHAVVNAKVYNNVVRNTGWDGIQVGAATQGCEVYNNEVENYGLRKNATHGNGIQLGEGTGGLCYNNIIKNGHWNGLQVLGYGDNVIFNNMVINTGNNGSFIDSRPPASPGNGFKFLNNTIVNPGANGVLIYASAANLSNEVKNNIIINPGIYDEYEKDPSWKSGKDAYVCILSPTYKNTAISNNFTSRKIDDAQFVDSKKEDFHLKASSPAINIGTDLSNWGVKFDMENVARPQNGAFDAGACEFKGSVNTNQTPVADAGNDETVKLPVAEITLDGSKSYDPDGSIVSFSWKQVSGPATTTIATPDQAKASVTGLIEGTYTFELSVADQDGASAKVQVKVTVEAAPVPAPSEGNLVYHYYEGTWNQLPDFSQLSAIASGTVDYFDLGVRQKDSNFAVVFEGYIEIPVSGDYTFELNSDDGSKLYIGGEEVVNNDGLHGSRFKEGTISLQTGVHPITVSFFEKSGKELLEVYWKNTAHGVTSRQLVPASALVNYEEMPVTPGTSPELHGVYINVSNAGASASSPWNNLNIAPETGNKSQNLLNDEGVNSGISLQLLDSWGGAGGSGVNTGNNSGIYPDDVIKSFYWDASPNTKSIKFSGLKQNTVYTFTFLASRAADGNRTTVFGIGEKAVTLNASNNSTSTVEIKGITANGAGEIIVDIKKGEGASYAYLNAIVIEETETTVAANQRVEPALTVQNSLNENAEVVSVYPNAIEDYISIDLNLEQQAEVFISITDNVGMQVYTSQTAIVEQGNSTLTFSDLYSVKPGIYIMEVYENNKKIKSVRIIK